MNKIFRVVYSGVRHCYVVVSEIAKQNNKKAEGGVSRNPFLLAAVTAALLAPLSFGVGTQASAENTPVVQEHVYAGKDQTTEIGKQDDASVTAGSYYIANGGKVLVHGKSVMVQPDIVKEEKDRGAWSEGTFVIGDQGNTEETKVVQFGGSETSQTEVHGATIEFGTQNSWNAGDLSIGDSDSDKVTVVNSSSGDNSQTTVKGKTIEFGTNSSWNAGNLSIGDSGSANVTVVNSNSGAGSQTTIKGKEITIGTQNVSNAGKMEIGDSDTANVEVVHLSTNEGSETIVNGNNIDFGTGGVRNAGKLVVGNTDNQLVKVGSLDSLKTGESIIHGKEIQFRNGYHEGVLTIGDKGSTGKVSIQNIVTGYGSSTTIHGFDISIGANSRNQGTMTIGDQGITETVTLGANSSNGFSNQGISNTIIHGMKAISFANSTTVQGKMNVGVGEDGSNEGAAISGGVVTVSGDLTQVSSDENTANQKGYLIVKGKSVDFDTLALSNYATVKIGDAQTNQIHTGHLYMAGGSTTALQADTVVVDDNVLVSGENGRESKEFTVNGKNVTLKNGLHQESAESVIKGNQITLGGNQQSSNKYSLQTNAGTVDIGSADSEVRFNGAVSVLGSNGASVINGKTITFFHVDEGADQVNQGYVLRNQDSQLAIGNDQSTVTLNGGLLSQGPQQFSISGKSISIDRRNAAYSIWALGNAQIGNDNTQDVTIKGAIRKNTRGTNVYNLAVQGKRISLSDENNPTADIITASDGGRVSIGDDQTESTTIKGRIANHGADVIDIKGKHISLSNDVKGTGDGNSAFANQEIVARALHGPITIGSEAATDTVTFTGMLYGDGAVSVHDEEGNSAYKDKDGNIFYLDTSKWNNWRYYYKDKDGNKVYDNTIDGRNLSIVTLPGIVVEGKNISGSVSADSDATIVQTNASSVDIGTDKTDTVTLTGGKLMGRGADEINIKGKTVSITGNGSDYTAQAGGTAHIQIGSENSTASNTVLGGLIARGGEINLAGDSIFLTGNANDKNYAANAVGHDIFIGTDRTGNAQVTGNFFANGGNITLNGSNVSLIGSGNDYTAVAMGGSIRVGRQNAEDVKVTGNLLAAGVDYGEQPSVPVSIKLLGKRVQLMGSGDDYAAQTNGGTITLGDQDTLATTLTGGAIARGADITIYGKQIGLTGAEKDNDYAARTEAANIIIGTDDTERSVVEGNLLADGVIPPYQTADRQEKPSSIYLHGKNISVIGKGNVYAAQTNGGILTIGEDNTAVTNIEGGAVANDGPITIYGEQVRLTGNKSADNIAALAHGKDITIGTTGKAKTAVVEGKLLTNSGNIALYGEQIRINGDGNDYAAEANRGKITIGSDVTDTTIINGGLSANQADIKVYGKQILLTGNKDNVAANAMAKNGNAEVTTSISIGGHTTKNVDVQGTMQVSGSSHSISLEGQTVNFDKAVVNDGATLKVIQNDPTDRKTMEITKRLGMVEVQHGDFNGNFSGSNSDFYGAVTTDRTAGGEKSAQSEMSVSDGARWIVSADSNVSNVTGKDGIFDTLHGDNRGAKEVTVNETFTGSGNTFIMNLSDTNLEHRAETDKSDYWYFGKAKEPAETKAAAEDGARPVLRLMRVAVPNVITPAAPTESVEKLDINATKSTLQNMLPGDRVFFASVMDTQNQKNHITFVPKERAILANPRNLYNYEYQIGSDRGQDSTDWYLGVNDKTKKPNENITTPDKLLDSDYFLITDMDRFYKRMGEMKYIDGDQGLWVRTRHNSVEREDSFRYNGNRIQIGYDKKNDGNAYQGLAFSFDRGKVSMDDGKSDTKQYALSLYDSWLGSHGHYLDVVLTGGRLSDDLDAKTSEGASIRTDYHRWYFQGSAEYGRKMQRDDGIYFEPSVQLQYTHINSADTTTNHGVQWNFGSVDSLIGRAGFRVGNMADGKNFYLKADVLHEFSGDRAYSAFAADGSYHFSGGSHETWYDAGFGLDIKLDERSSFYTDFERVLGSHFNRTWNFNAGVRVKF